MADKDTITKEYMRHPDIFADAFNFLLYDGEQVIKPEQLRELDTTAIATPYGNDGTVTALQKSRDGLQAAMEDGEMAYLILGIENQSDIHYAMPVRNMLYDAMEYSDQVSKAAKANRKSGGSTKEEYLSGFRKTDKLLPVVTLVIYFGANEWTAPRSIHEMLYVKHPAVLKFTPDYKINLIAPQEIADEDMQKFHSDLRMALQYIKYHKDKEHLQNLLQQDGAYSSVPNRTARIIKAMTGTNIQINEEKESVDMCEAIQQMINEGRAEGEAKGRAEGRAAGIAEMIKNMLADGMPYETAAKYSGLSMEEVKRIAGELTA